MRRSNAIPENDLALLEQLWALEERPADLSEEEFEPPPIDDGIEDALDSWADVGRRSLILGRDQNVIWNDLGHAQLSPLGTDRTLTSIGALRGQA